MVCEASQPTGSRGRWAFRIVVVGSLLLSLASLEADGADPRLDRVVNLRTDRFPFEPPATVEAWEERASAVRRQVQVAAGLWPMPPRPTPLATIQKRIERDGYVVEAVSLESFPGHYVTGSLYRPAKGDGAPRPGVLCPHGHWNDGRFHSWGEDELAKQLASGAERFHPSGRHPLQARCVQLARMGCVVFLYDMLGYGDSRQLWLEAIHAPTEETIFAEPNAWGFYSAQAELRMQGPLGVQTYNSLCALDWLESLDEVDPKRIGVTGGSSGATQTLMLCAIDDRPRVAFPVVMVSTAMQGGCGCENACCLRLGASNVEFAALMAPKPLGMASADDWTRSFAEDGYPQLQQLYAMLRHPERLTHASLIQFPHNYNHASRAAMYPWLARWLDLPLKSSIVESDFIPLTQVEASSPPTDEFGGPENREPEVRLMRVMAEQSEDLLDDIRPRDEASLQAFREVVGGALHVLLDSADAALDSQITSRAVRDSSREHEVVALSIRNVDAGVDLPAVALLPSGAKSIVVMATDAGKSAVLSEGGEASARASRLLEAGVGVLGVDLYAQGELAPPGGLGEAPTPPDARPIASLTYGYNRTAVAHRASDLLAAIAAARELTPDIERVGVLACNGTSSYAAAALAVAGDLVDASVIETGGFRFAQLTSWRDLRFLPGAVKYGDLPGLLALAAPRPTILVGDSSRTDRQLTVSAYHAAGHPGALVVFDEDSTVEQAIEQLTEQLIESSTR